MQHTTKNLDLDKLHTNVLYLGLVLNFFAPAVLLSLGIFLRNQGVGARSIEGLDVLLWVLLAVSGGEVLAIYLLKKKILFARNMAKVKDQGASAQRVLVRSALILFSLSLSPAIYGLVYFLLGGTVERFVLFIAITLLCFLLFKPKLEEIKSVANTISDLSDNR
jgi:hypothetical protein